MPYNLRSKDFGRPLRCSVAPEACSWCGRSALCPVCGSQLRTASLFVTVLGTHRCKLHQPPEEVTNGFPLGSSHKIQGPRHRYQLPQEILALWSMAEGRVEIVPSAL